MEDSGAGAPRVGVSQPRRGGTTWHHLAMASTLSSRLKQALVEEGLLCQLGGRRTQGAYGVAAVAAAAGLVQATSTRPRR